MAYIRQHFRGYDGYLLMGAEELGLLSAYDIALVSYLPAAYTTASAYLRHVEDPDFSVIHGISTHHYQRLPETEKRSFLKAFYSANEYQVMALREMVLQQLSGTVVRFPPSVSVARYWLHECLAHRVFEADLDLRFQCFEYNHDIDVIRRDTQTKNQDDAHHKRTLKRAFKMASRFGFDTSVRLLLNKNTIRVMHPESKLIWEFRMHRFGLTPQLSTLLIEKATQKPLATVCAYLKDTPAIDTFIAFSQFINQGLETEILVNANLFKLSAASKARLDALNLTYKNQHDKPIAPQPIPTTLNPEVIHLRVLQLLDLADLDYRRLGLPLTFP